jgi:hypothetical protein
MTTSIMRPRPFWRVQSVFDPDGTGKDFAYTIGLYDRGLPELHVWARPSLGEDPGHDWLLSPNDRAHLLNELAQLLVDGGLEVGTTLTREYDAGLATVTFEVAPPGDRDELEAYGVGPGALVLPVLWSLRRPAEGALVPLTERARAAAQETYAELVDGMDGSRRAPRGWALPATPSFEVDQRYGPLTAVVLARAAQLWQCSDESLEHLLYMATCEHCEGSLTGPVAVAAAAARPVGRRPALEALLEDAPALVEHITERPAGQRRWKAVVRGVFPDLWNELDRSGRAAAEQNFAHMLRDVTLGCLAVEAVADVADPHVLLWGRGSWLAGMRRQSVLTLPDWRASPGVLDTVRRLLEPLDAGVLAAIAAAHEFARARAEPGGYGELATRLQTWAVASGGSCPWEPLLAGLPAWEPLAAASPGVRVGVLPDLEHWATCVTSALTHRDRLSDRDVTVFAIPVLSCLPGLASVLERPP